MSTAYRADQVGSLLRPAELLAARRAGLPIAELRAIEDRYILRALERQAELGFEICTDGEFRRRTFQSDFIEAVDGFDTAQDAVRTWKTPDGQEHTVGTLGVVVGKLRQRERLTAHELPFLQANASVPIKMTTASANQYPAIAWKAGISDAFYPDRSDLLPEIAQIIAAETAWLADQGVAYIQIDAPRYSYYVDPKWRAWLKSEMGKDPDALLADAIAADNLAFDAARRSGVTVAIHLCRGNNRSQWYAEGGYDAIAEQIFSQLRVDRFLLEYDDERSGSFAPLRYVPKGKTVVLGLISSKLPELEDSDAVARRIDEAAKVLPLDALALSPQCGFASVMEGNALTEEQQWAKLGLVTQVARKVWG